ncbi:hypothetical protein ANO14919_014680 [Xylariales sp. No.14919]|nr:hypothetical protein ANO14919_014680 [Xylariales sp. No.14919]
MFRGLQKEMGDLVANSLVGIEAKGQPRLYAS